MKRWGVVALATMAFMVTACVSEVSGVAVKPDNAGAFQSPPTYLSLLNPRDQEKVQYKAGIRAIDPCGYVDEAALGKVGVVKTFSASGSQQDCQAEIVVDRDAQRSLELRVAVIPFGSIYEQEARTVTVGGVDILENIDRTPGKPADAGVNMCYHLLPFDQQSKLLIDVLRRTNEAPCAETRIITESVVPLLKNRPQRAGSPWGAFHAVSVKDPCAGLSAIANNQKVTLSGFSRSPWRCEFVIADQQKDDDRVIELNAHPSASFDKPYSGSKTTVDGHAAIQSAFGSRCNIQVAVGDPADGYTYEPIGDPKLWTNAIDVTAASCETATSTAREAARAFLG